MIDLHIHSFYSNGELSPEEIIKYAHDKGAKIISITDHNSVQAYMKPLNTATTRIIPGVELTASLNGRNIHILGYDFDVSKMNRLIQRFYPSRISEVENNYKRASKILKKRGYRFPKKPDFRNNEGLISCLLRNMKTCKQDGPQSEFLNKSFAYHEINKIISKYIPEEKGYPNAVDVIKMIHESGGLAFIAHPFDEERGLKNMEKELCQLCLMGIDGIETEHPSAYGEQREYLRSFVNKFHLYRSGGSDFHNNNNWKMFSQNIEYRDLRDWL